jgi:hypothetical protein
MQLGIIHLLRTSDMQQADLVGKLTEALSLLHLLVRYLNVS